MNIHVDAGGLPVALAAARDAARQRRGEARRLILHAGVYFLEEPLVLDARDSGLTIEAAPGEKVILYGGRLITNWQPESNGLWSAHLPEVAARRWDFRALVVNGRLCQRARLPHQGYFSHLSEFPVCWLSTTGGGWERKPTPQELTTLRYCPEDLSPWLQVANAELTIYHQWDESLVGLAALDAAAHTVTFANSAGHPPGAFGVKRYVVWNVREGMHQPGQWYLDRAVGKVVYWPPPGEDVASAEAIAPIIESIIRLEGTEQAPVENVTLHGLTLSVTNTPLIAGGFGAGRFSGALAARFARNCHLERLTVVNVAGQGIKAQDCVGLQVTDCCIHDTGACGVFVAGAQATIANNHIRHVGLCYPSAIALWCTGRNAVISHNAVHDVPYTGIAASGEGHRIEANRIERVMTELRDGAAIYITFCKRVQVCGNFVRAVADADAHKASGYYLDEQAENCLVEANVAVSCAWPSHNHMARNNTVRNNIFVSDSEARLTFPRCAGFHLERNVIHAQGKIILTNPDAIAAMPNNILFSAAGSVAAHRLDNYKRVREEPLSPRDGTIFANPLLCEHAAGRYEFAAASPALARGIRPVDASGAGPSNRHD